MKMVGPLKRGPNSYSRDIKMFASGGSNHPSSSNFSIKTSNSKFRSTQSDFMSTSFKLNHDKSRVLSRRSGFRMKVTALDE